jgi:hypothetical protein
MFEYAVPGEHCRMEQYFAVSVSFAMNQVFLYELIGQEVLDCWRYIQPRASHCQAYADIIYGSFVQERKIKGQDKGET